MKFPQTFVSYHGCGNCYLDGTNQLVTKNKLFLCRHTIHFGKDQKILVIESQDQQHQN